jgi:hypothetical protein
VSVPPAVLQQFMRQKGQQGAPGAMQTGSGAPAGAPMATPSPKQGLQEVARTQVKAAMKVLSTALVGFGADTDEGKSVLKALTSLSKNFGKTDESDLVPAELLQMVRSNPAAAAKLQQQGQQAQAPAQGAGGAQPGGGQPPQPV